MYVVLMLYSYFMQLAYPLSYPLDLAERFSTLIELVTARIVDARRPTAFSTGAALGLLPRLYARIIP